MRSDEMRSDELSFDLCRVVGIYTVERNICCFKGRVRYQMFNERDLSLPIGVFIYEAFFRSPPPYKVDDMTRGSGAY